VGDGVSGVYILGSVDALYWIYGFGVLRRC